MWKLINRTLTHHEKAYDNLPVDEQLTTQVRLTLTDGSGQSAKVRTRVAPATGLSLTPRSVTSSPS